MTKPQANSKRPEKLAAIKEIDAFVESASFAFVLNYGGLTVEQFSNLRSQLVKTGAVVKVVKNSYLAKAFEKKQWTNLEAFLGGPVALVAGSGDPAEVAKIVCEFTKKNDKASVKGGQLDADTLDEAKVKELSALPNKDGMRAMLLSMLQAPFRGVLYALKAKAEKDGGPAEAPAAEAPAADAPQA